MPNQSKAQMHQKEMSEIAIIEELIKQKNNLKVTKNGFAGKGSFGYVLYVENQVGDIFALKVISLSKNEDNSVCHAIQSIAENEAKTLEQFDHPNIVKMFDHFQIGIYYFILMEKCEMSLQEFVDRGLHKNMNRNRFIKIAIQLSKALKYIQEKFCILRDLALKNILIDKHDNIKICDFGTARFFNPQLKNQTLINSSSEPLELEGTKFYYPPEIFFQNYKQDQSTVIQQTQAGDIWAFGICLFIFSGVSQANVYQCIFGNQDFINQYSFDSNIKQIILKILNRNPINRPSIDQILDDFNNYQNIIKDCPQLDLVDSNQIELNEQNIKIVYECDTPHEQEQNVVEWIDEPKDQKNFTSSNELFRMSADYHNLTINLQSSNQNETDDRNYLSRNKQQRQIRIQN